MKQEDPNQAIEGLVSKVGNSCCCACFNASTQFNIPYGYSGVILRFGRFHRVVDSGYHTINNLTESHVKINMQITSCALGRQKILTKDCVSLFINSYARYSIMNIEVCFKRLGKDFSRIDKIVRCVAKGALKNVVGDYTMEELLKDSRALG